MVAAVFTSTEQIADSKAECARAPTSAACWTTRRLLKTSAGFKLPAALQAAVDGATDGCVAETSLESHDR